MSRDISAQSRTQASRTTRSPCATYANLSAWLRNYAFVASLIVFFCSASVRLFMVSRADPNELVLLYSDAATYLSPAEHIIDRGAFLDHREKPTVHRTPGYPVFLASIMLLVGRDLRTVLIAQTIIISLGPLILYWLGRRILPPVMAITGGLIAAFSPWGAVLAGIPMSDGLFVTLLTVLFFLMKLTQDLQNSKAFLGAACIGCLTGIAVLVRPIWPVMILVPGAFLISYGPKREGVWLLLVITFLCAVAPVALWSERNQREVHFNGLSDIPGQTAWQFLAARVIAEASGQNRHTISKRAAEEEHIWGLGLSNQELDDERWRRARAVFREHPFLTCYSFARSAFEHMIHPSPDVLRNTNLGFGYDLEVLGTIWGGLLLLSGYAVLRCRSDRVTDDGSIDWQALIAISAICLVLTVLSGISFAAGSRLRAPLECIVPLLASVGLVRIGRGLFEIQTNRR